MTIRQRIERRRMRKRLSRVEGAVGSIDVSMKDGYAIVLTADGVPIAATWRGRRALRDAGLCTPVRGDDAYVEPGSAWRVRPPR